MNKEEIKKFLPHREPMLLLDEIELINGKSHAKYLIKGDEFFLQGHYPGNPVVPGVIQCEIMAQSCSILLLNKLIGKTPLYAGLDKVRFKHQVKPGDLFEVIGELVDQKRNIFFCKAEGFVNNVRCVTAELMFALV